MKCTKHCSDLGTIDGVNIWQALSEDQASERTEVLHNIDDIYGNAALTIGEWKIVKGSTYQGAWDFWYGPSGREGNYDLQQVKLSSAGKAVASLDRLPGMAQMKLLRQEAEVRCEKTETSEEISPCKPLKEPCLFNIQRDPCERRNLANV